MNGAEAEFLCKAKELITEGPVTFAEHMIDHGIQAEPHSWGFTWREFLKYAQGGDRGRLAKENARTNERKEEIQIREPHPTLYPGEVEGEDEVEPGNRRRNVRELTDRAKANQHRQERRKHTYRNKRIRLVEGGNGLRKVSD
eukprot:229319-Pleurochrysis_carterae.AAC.2